MQTLSQYTTKHGRKLLLNISDCDDFWLIQSNEIQERIVYLDESTAQQVAIAMLKKLGHQCIVFNDYDDNGDTKGVIQKEATMKTHEFEFNLTVKVTTSVTTDDSTKTAVREQLEHEIERLLSEHIFYAGEDIDIEAEIDDVVLEYKTLGYLTSF